MRFHVADKAALFLPPDRNPASSNHQGAWRVQNEQPATMRCPVRLLLAVVVLKHRC
jgi:hypothetical protein